MSSSTKFSKHMCAHKGVEDRRRDAVKVNELAAAAAGGGGGGAGGSGGPAKHPNRPVKVALAGRVEAWGRGGGAACLSAIK